MAGSVAASAGAWPLRGGGCAPTRHGGDARPREGSKAGAAARR
jgi:hypothetical protein